MWSILDHAVTAVREWSKNTEEIFTITKSVLLIFFTASCLIQDIKKRTISLKTFEIFGLSGIALFICSMIYFRSPSGLYIEEFLMMLLLPAALLFISYLTGESLGFGDSLYFLVSALYLSPKENFIMFVISVAAAGIAGLVFTVLCMAKGRSARRKSLPFMTFIFPAAVITLLL